MASYDMSNKVAQKKELNLQNPATVGGRKFDKQ